MNFTLFILLVSVGVCIFSQPVVEDDDDDVIHMRRQYPTIGSHNVYDYMMHIYINGVKTLQQMKRYRNKLNLVLRKVILMRKHMDRLHGWHWRENKRIMQRMNLSLPVRNYDWYDDSIVQNTNLTTSHEII